MRLVKAFLFAAVAAAVVAVPSHESQAFLMEGIDVAPLNVWPGGFAPRISCNGVMMVQDDSRISTSYITAPGDKLRTKDDRGVLDRFGVSVSALREANPDALVPVCVNARLQPNGLTTCGDVHWFLREHVTLAIPRPETSCGSGLVVTF